MSQTSGWGRRLLWFLVGLVTVVAGWAYYQLGTHVDAPVDPAWAVQGSTEIPPGAVTVRYTGTATLVFSDGETKWATDGWFTRPSPAAFISGSIEPDLAAIEAGLERNQVDQLAAVFPVHSHYDHAMDAPEVARRTGAILLGSESTANIGRGWGLPEEQVHVVEHLKPVAVGRFTLTPIETRHFQFPDAGAAASLLEDPKIHEPLVPPVGVFDYRLGKAYAIHVAHPLGTWLIVGSAGYVEGLLENFRADLVFLGTGGLGGQTSDYQEAYWRESIETTQPTRIIPIHWDSLTAPIEGPFKGSLRILGAGSDQTLELLKAKESAHPEIEFLTLPRYDEVVLFTP